MPIMSRPIVLIVTSMLMVAYCTSTPPTAVAQSIIPQSLAEQHGLARPWIAQVQVSRGLGRVTDLTLYEDTLFAQTDRGLIQAIDAESGATMWTRQVGNPAYPTLRVGAGGDLLGVINGMTLYVLNRYNGKLLYEKQVDHTPGAGPAVSSRWAYAPMITGLVVAYRLQPLTDPMLELGVIDEREPTEAEQREREERRRENIRLDQQFRKPLAAQTSGRIMSQPVATYSSKTAEYCAWTTQRGHLNVGFIDPDAPERLEIKYRIEADDPITSPPAYLPPAPDDEKSAGILLASSEDGFVYAIAQSSGESLWRYSSGEPIIARPALAYPRVFVCNQLGGMHCIDIVSGRRLWWAPKIRQFLAASNTLVYAVDIHGRLVSHDLETGAWIDSMPLPKHDIAIQNTQNDRIYLANAGGLVQCLHELGVDEPIRQNRLPTRDELRAEREAAEQAQPEPEATQQPTPEPAGAQPAGEPDPFAEAAAAEQQGQAEANPFGGGDAAAGADENPFGGGGAPAGDANPFGGGGGGDATEDPFAPGAADDPFGG